MAGVAKVTLFYQQYDYGWTESLWINYAGTLADVAPQADALAKASLSVRGDGVAINVVRISDDIIYRDSIYTDTTYYCGASVPDYIPQGQALTQVKRIFPAPAPAQNAYDAVQVRMESGSIYRREAYYRGLPAAIFTNPPGPNFNLIPNYQQAMTQLATYLKTPNQWLFRVKNDSGTYAKQTVTQSNPTAHTITVPGTTLVDGNYVQLVGFRGLSGYRGKYFVSGAPGPGGVVTLLGFAPTVATTTPKGYVQLLSVTGNVPQPTYVPITSFFPRTQTRKSTGRPSFGPRGRSRARAAGS